MYLSDFREYCLKDVITQLEPHLFRKVTGLTEKDFELLVSLNVFNEALMNDAVYKFKRYEDASLVYTGINRHAEENVGLYATVLSREDYEKMAGAQQDSMVGAVEEKVLPSPTADDRIACRPEEEEEEPPPAPNVRIRKGTLLTHREYGTGIVVKLDESSGRMTVKFGEEKKLFPYPRSLEQGKLIPAEKAIPEKRGINLSIKTGGGVPYCSWSRIILNSRLTVRTTRQSSSTAATDKPMMNPVQMPRAPMAGTIQSVRARM